MDMGMDTGAADDADSRWMTYGELALARGIDRTSALKLALRNKWRKQRDNRNVVHVLVPAEWATRRDKGAALGADAAVDMGAAPGADIARAINVLETALKDIRERADAEANALRGQIEQEKQRATLAESRTSAERERSLRLEAELSELRALEHARQGRGFLKRLRDAVRGG